MLEDVISAYNEAVFDTNRKKALDVVHEALKNGVSPEDVVFKIVTPAIEQMIKSISENFDTNIAQHFMASQIAAEVTEEMIAKFKKRPTVTGHIIIGTAQGDFHALGKEIVIGCLKSFMIGVTDLGINVSPERYVDEAVNHNAEVIGISSMMVHTARGENGCLKVREILKERELEDKIKIIVGGAPYRYDANLYKIVEADTWAKDGITAGKIISDLIKEVRR